MKPSIHSLEVMARSQGGIVKTARQFDVVTADLRNIFPMKFTAYSQKRWERC